MIAIIGTAGRNDDAARLSNQSFSRMLTTTLTITRNQLQIKDGECEWISGGSAWVDHVVVRLFGNGIGKSLTLALPCAWDKTNARYLDTGETNWRTNPGRTINYYHAEFSKKLHKGDEKRTLMEIQTAIERGAIVEVGNGFFDRNTRVSEADAIIAFTFGRGARLRDGGTADTMGKFLTKNNVGAFHVDLNDWKVYDNPIVS